MWIAVAVTPLVAENITNSVSASTARPVSESATPAQVSSTSSPSRYAATCSPTSAPLPTSSSSSAWTRSTVLRVSSTVVPGAKVEAVEVYHLVPGRHEVTNELLLRVAARVNLGERPQLRVRAENEIGRGGRPLRVA